MVRTDSSRYLLIDVIREILSLLPSKSLLRFRCVCKSWRELITDPNFIEFHRNQNNNSYVLIQHDRRTFSLHCEKTFVPHTRVEFPPPNPKLRVLGYSNGLVCLSIAHPKTFHPNTDQIYLWNPSIRKFKLLPDSSFHTTCDFKTRANFAFAFVSQINDYRALKIMCRYDNIDVVVKSEIYSLRTNSWKIVECEVNCQLVGTSFVNVINGVVLFMARDVAANNYIILSFNMVDEVFRKIMIPKAFNQYLADKELYPKMVGELLLVIRLSYEESRPSDMVDIWAMNEHGAVESLTKKLSFDYWIQLLGFLKNGELVFRYENTPNKLSSYDPILSEIKDLQFIGVPENIQTVTHYMESLVLLNDQGCGTCSLEG